MLVVPAYAKVNLSLEVLGRRPDGFHDLRSVVATVDWHDLVGLRLEPGVSPDAAEPALHLSGPGAREVPADGANLALRAAEELARIAARPLAAAISLDKQIPPGAGLGGGSADAAAVLRAGAALLGRAGVHLGAEALLDAAARLGSDVPALLAGGGCLLLEGRGEQLQRLADAELHLVVAVTVPCPTAAVYAALTDAERRDDGTRSLAVADALGAGRRPPEAALGSGLEAAARRAVPGLGDALDRLRAALPDTSWHLTGSGGAAFCLVADPGGAARQAAAARRLGFPARACRTIPAPAGAAAAGRREAEQP